MFAVIYLPGFFLQAIVRSDPALPTQPVAVMDAAAKSVIIQLNSPAAQQGVALGLTSSQALARCRKLLIKNRSPAQESAATDLLLQVAYQFSPSIESTAPGVATLDLAGLVDAGSEEWAAHILRQLKSFQLEGRMGLGTTPDLAWLAAQVANPICLVTDTDAFVGTLPLPVLQPAPSVAEILVGWGIHFVGDFLRLGKDKIAERLGAEGTDLFDRASARQIRPLKLVRPVEHFEEVFEFEQEVQMIEPLLFVLRRFVDQICQRLTASYAVAAEMVLRLELASHAAVESVLRVPSPTWNPEALFRMIFTHLENIKTEHPIISVRLVAHPCAARFHQFDLFEASLRNPNHFYEMIARVGALLGPDRVGTPVAAATHRPDTFRMEPPQFGSRVERPVMTGKQTGLMLRRFRPALPTTVEVRADRPAMLNSPGFTGPVAKAAGPYRTSGNWWGAERWNREEWDVQTRRGQLLRLYREEERWYIEGIFD